MNKHSIGERDGAEPSQKRAKVALPTKDEQKQLQQVDLLMKSNLLQLEIEQLLSEVSGDNLLAKKKVTAWVHTISELLKAPQSFSGLPSNLSEKSIKDAGLKSMKAMVLVNTEDESMKLNFQAPAAVEVIGSYVHHTALTAMLNVDIAVTMPATLFDSRDILNHRYFDKRKLYLLGLYQCLNKQSAAAESPLFSAVSFATFKGDVRKPILLLEAPFALSGSEHPLVIRLIPVIPESTFKGVQLRNNKNNVRPANWNSKNSNATEGEDTTQDADALPPTPLYNLAILEDMCVLTQHKILIKTVTAKPLAEALLLFKVWQTQRGFRFAADGFDAHCASLLLSYLLLTRRIPGGTNATALSAFQTMLTFISEGHLLHCSLDFRSSELGARRALPNYHASVGAVGSAAGSNNCASNGGGPVLDDSSVCFSPDVRHSSVLGAHMWDYKRPLSLVHPVAAQAGGEPVRYNAYWRVSASAADMLQSEARRSLSELQHQTAAFEHLFMHSRSFFERHDQFYHIILPAKALPFLCNSSIHLSNDDMARYPTLKAVNDMSVVERRELRSMLLHCAPQDHFAALAVQTLSRGLGDRAVAVHSNVRAVEPWSGSNDSTDETAETTPIMAVSAHTPVWDVATMKDHGKLRDFVISIGVVLDKEKLDRRVERGPVSTDVDMATDPALLHSNGAQASTAVSDELTRFRALWGPKVQLRRFKDGAIQEAVVWDNHHSMVEQVVKYLLGRHLPALSGDEGQLVRCVNAQLEQTSNIATAADDSHSRRAVEALDQLRGLTNKLNLPLSFENLSAVTPELRYTSMYAPTQHPIALANTGEPSEIDKATKRMLKQKSAHTITLLAPPLRVLVQVESSGKWPQDAVAIRKTKLALLLKTRTELKSHLQICSVVHEDDLCLDVCYEGFIFRLQLVASQEIEAIQLAAGASKVDTAALYRSVIRSTVVAPLHHLGVRALRSQFPSYTAAVKLMHSWAAQHYFSGHLCLEMIELLVAYEYLHPFTTYAPASPLAGFYRSLLRLAEHNWDADPFIVDLSGDSKEISGNASVLLDIITKFRAVRECNMKDSTAATEVDLDYQTKRRFNAAMYVVSSADKAHEYYPSLAEKSPERVVLSAVVKAARHSADQMLAWMQRTDTVVADAALSAQIMSSTTLLEQCDLVLSFNGKLANKSVSDGPAFARLEVFANTPVAEAQLGRLIVSEAECTAHPLQEQLVQKLRVHFGDTALFFWDARSGRHLGVLWRPVTRNPAPFAVLTSKLRTPELRNDQGAANSTMTEVNLQEVVAQMLDLSDGLLLPLKQ